MLLNPKDWIRIPHPVDFPTIPESQVQDNNCNKFELILFHKHIIGIYTITL